MTTAALLSTGGNLIPSHAVPLHFIVPPTALPGAAVFQRQPHLALMVPKLHCCPEQEWADGSLRFLNYSKCSAKNVWDPVG